MRKWIKQSLSLSNVTKTRERRKEEEKIQEIDDTPQNPTTQNPNFFILNLSPSNFHICNPKIPNRCTALWIFIFGVKLRANPFCYSFSWRLGTRACLFLLINAENFFKLFGSKGLIFPPIQCFCCNDLGENCFFFLGV